MNAPHTTRRGFIRMLIGTPILHYALTQEIFASTQIRSSYITWRSGCFLPIPSSPSFLGAKENVLFALEHGLKKFGDYKSEITFTCTSPQSMTVFDFLKEKQKEGLLSLGLQNFDGLGSYIHSVNGISEQRLSSLYWKIKVNDFILSSGISAYILKKDDVVSLILTSAYNDSGVFTDSLGDYSKVIVTDSTPMWEGKILTNEYWPRVDRGSMRHDFFEINAKEGTTFIPNTIICTKETYSRNTSLNRWEKISSANGYLTSSYFIGKSWRNGSLTNSSEPSTKMIFGNTGFGFPPYPSTGSEEARIEARIRNLRAGKYAFVTLLKVSFSDGSNTSYQWMTLGDPVSPFKKDDQPLLLGKDRTLSFDSKPGETGTVEIQTSPDCKDWKTHLFTDNPHEAFQLPPGERFARAIRR